MDIASYDDSRNLGLTESHVKVIKIYGITDVLSDLGGFMKIIFTLFSIVVTLFVTRKFFKDLDELCPEHKKIISYENFINMTHHLNLLG